MNKVREDFVSWSYTQAGTILSSDLLIIAGEDCETILEGIREERLANMLSAEAIEAENEWIDYEFEEGQTQIDASDGILKDVIVELIHILND